MKKRNKGVNYLDLVPKVKNHLKWKTKDNGTVVIIRENRGPANKIANFLFGTPKETKVSLDEYGNFIWHLIDGKNSVYIIALKVKEKYGDKAEPLYDRICQYFRALEVNDFVNMN